MTINKTNLPPVQIHFKENFPLETRCLTEDEEYAVVEILKVEYGLDKNGDNYDLTLFVSGIKSFSMSDDDQECFISWQLKPYGLEKICAKGTVGTGNLEMGERFTEKECIIANIPKGEYSFEIIYV